MKQKFPFQQNGMTYGPGPDGQRVCTGAQMGRRNEVPADSATVRKVHLRRVPFVDQCYDQGGAYWGSPANLWCAWGDSETERAVFYCRAPNRESAKAATLRTFINAKFYR